MWDGTQAKGLYNWIFLIHLLSISLFSVVSVCAAGFTKCDGNDDCNCSSIKKSGKIKMVCPGNIDKLRTIEELKLISEPSEIGYLDLSGNMITALKKDVFVGLQNLERLNLSKNNIKLIELGAFNGLEKLKRLDLSMNSLTILNNTIFSGLTSLERILLGGNKLRTITAGTFDGLPNLQRLNLGREQVRCDCHVQWIPKLLKENPNIKLSTNSTCGSPEELKRRSIKELTKKDLHCDWPLELTTFELTPSVSQIVFQGDNMQFECKASMEESFPNLTWYRMGQPVTTNTSLEVYVFHDAIPKDSLVAASQLLLNKPSPEDNGVWKCVASSFYGNRTLSVNILVIPFEAVICLDVVTKTNKGTFKWNRAISSTTPTIECPYAVFTMYNGNVPHAFYKCNAAGKWEGLNVDACPYQSEVTRTLQQCAEVNTTLLVKQAAGLKSVITEPSNITDKDDVKFMAQIMERLLNHMAADNSEELSEVMLHLASVLVDVNSNILYEAQSEEKACSRIITVLEKMAAKQLEYNGIATGYSQNVAFYSYKVNQVEFTGIVCTSYSMTTGNKGYSSDSFKCDTKDIKPGKTMDSNVEASISIPGTIFDFVRCLFNVCDHREPFKIEVILYRKASLFQHVNNEPGRVVQTSVISAKIVQEEDDVEVEGTLKEPIVIHLKSSKQGIKQKAVYWDFTINNGFGGWVSNNGCDIKDKKDNVSVIHCQHLTNFAVIQSVTSTSGQFQDWLAGTFNMSPMVYAGSIILVTCVFVTAITYMVCRSTIQMPKKMKHCVPNLCLAILFLCVTYTIGVKTTDLDLFCKVIGISIHYFSLCVLFWMNIATYVMYKKFQKSQLPPRPPDPDAPVKPVFGIYLLGWGVALILCGIVAAINSLQHYSNPQYCFLLTGARVYSFYVPAACLTIINIAFFICIWCTVQGDLNNHRDEPETEEIPVDDECNTNIDSITPTTNMDSITPVITCRNPSQGSNLTSNSQYSSIMDIQYKPVTQLHGMLLFLVLYVITWFSGALAVALPFNFTHQGIVLNCAYLVCSIAFGIFIIIFFVFGRKDGKQNWYKTCCFYKSNEYNVHGGNHSNSNLRHTNGHVVQSISSLDGSQYTNKSSNTNRSSNNPYRYGPISPLERSDLSILHTNPPATLDNSIAASVPEYPNFFNAKQNGIAKKYWQKNRQKHRIAQLNRDLKKNSYTRQKDINSRVSFDDSSDQNTHISLEIQLEPRAFAGMGPIIGNDIKPIQNFYPSLGKYGNLGQFGVTIDGPKNGRTPPLIVPYDRYQMAPMVGVSSPPSTTALLPPDGGSFISTDISSPAVPPAPMTSPQSSGINYIPSSHSLPRPHHKPIAPISQYMQRNGSVPRLRDFDGKSSTSRETRPLSIGSDSQTTEPFLSNRHNDYHNNRMRSAHSKGRDVHGPHINGKIINNHIGNHDKLYVHSDRLHNRSADEKGPLRIDVPFPIVNSSNVMYNTKPLPPHIPVGFLPQQSDHNGINTDDSGSELYRLQNNSANNNNSSCNSNSGGGMNCSKKPPIMPRLKQTDNNMLSAEEMSLPYLIGSQEQSYNPHIQRKKSSPPADLDVPGIVNLTSFSSVNNSMEESDSNCNLLPVNGNKTVSDAFKNIAANGMIMKSNSSKVSSSTGSSTSPEMEGLLSVEQNMNGVNGRDDEGDLNDIWKPQRPSINKLKNMETCV